MKNELIPQNPNGKIVHLKTEQDCFEYLDKESLQRLNNSLSKNQKIQDLLPFYIEYTKDKTIKITEDMVFQTIPQVFRCDTLSFEGGSITSFVHLVVDATITELVKPSSKNNYQILVSGTRGIDGASMTIVGAPGENGPDGSDETNKAGGKATNGKAPVGKGFRGGNATDGGNTPLSNLNFGTIKLSSNDLFTVLANGGSGGNGGKGGKGGKGGHGGKGGNAQSTSCSSYNGGHGGNGGDGGIGGTGGAAGSGSTANSDMIILIDTQADKNNLSSTPNKGVKGNVGPGGDPGDPGDPGKGGSGSACGGNKGPDGVPGANGTRGTDGPVGYDGTLPQIHVKFNKKP